MNARALWIAVALLLLFLGLSTGAALYYRLFLGLLAVPALGFLASVLAARRIEGGVQRLTAYLQVGDDVEERIVLRNTHWWPKLLLEVQHDTQPFGRAGRIATLWPYGSASWTSSSHCERRGIYRFGELEITSRDPFGLFSRTMRLGEPQSALIYPATVDLSDFFVLSGRGWTEGIVQGRTFTPSPIAAGVREYTSRDAVSRVHWPATAHTGRLMVKEFDREPSGPADAIWVVLDLDERMQEGKGSESTVEYGVTTAASVAKRFLDSGRNVGAVISGAEQVVIPADSGITQLGRIFQALALVEPGSTGGVQETSDAVKNQLSSGASIVLITAAPPAIVSSALDTLWATGASVIPVLLDAPSFSQGGARATQVSGFDAYVIRMGDEIGNRLDYHSAPPSLAVPAQDLQRVAR